MKRKEFNPTQAPPTTVDDRRENFARTMAAAAVVSDIHAEFEPVLSDLQVTAKTSLSVNRNTLSFITEEDQK